jgi:hypothetical protein
MLLRTQLTVEDRGSGYISRFVLFLIVFCVIACSAGNAFSEDPVARLKDETLAYFRPLKGKVTGVEGNLVSADLGTKSGVKAGMRLIVLREGAPFLHPVTKEPLGKTEAAVGTVQVNEVREDGALLSVMKGDVRQGDLLRISEMKVRMLFFQDKSVDWGLAEHYYRLLKESGRIEFVDTPLDTGDDEAVLEEARKKDCTVALALRGTEAGGVMVVRQTLFWVEGSAKIAEEEMKVESSYVKELNLGEAMYSPTVSAGDALLFFDLPFSGRLVASGDLYGDGHMELIITSGRYIRVFAPGASLQNLYEIKGGSSDDFLWIDTLDIDGDGKDEIIVTSMRGGDTSSAKTGGTMSGDPPSRTGSIVSSVYALRGQEFSEIWRDNVFLRRLGNQLIAQAYGKGEGFEGPVYTLSHQNGEFRKGDAIKLPAGVNIYDFAPISGLDGMNYILAYDDSGYMNLYNKEGMRVWRSNADSGGFETTYKKDSPTIMVGRGVWAIKDRLLSRNREAFSVKRVPLANVARGLGYSSSQIKALVWTGLSMEERVLIDGISGSILDYTVVGDRLVVLSKPLFGFKVKNLAKGESPLGSLLYVYSLTGR